MKNNAAIFTVVYPGVENYIDNFFRSACEQTNKDFDILICNDGLNHLKDYCQPYDHINMIEVIASGTPAKVREVGINYILSDTDYEFVIFADSDDLLSEERVEAVLGFLGRYDIVVNDLDLFDDSGVFDRGYLSRRIKHLTEIKSDMVQTYNFMGLSNTSIKRECLKRLILPDKLIAVDWYLFASMLYDGCDAVFIDNATTLYRQYPNNTVGLGLVSRAKLHRMILAKYFHYLEMAKIYPCYRDLSEKYRRMLYAIDEGMDLYEQFLSMIDVASIPNPLWWEETVVLEDMF